MLADGRPFEWRGITAFRLLEQEAAGQGDAVDRYLAWVADRQLTVVRVLAMAQHLFELTPDRGLAHLEGLLRRAQAHGLRVEIVALADTASYEIDPAAHVDAVAAIAARYPNAFLEIANEPYHGTQQPRVRDDGYLMSLLGRVPPGVIASAGEAGYPRVYRQGSYATVHMSRSSGANGWGHVRDLIEGRRMLAETRRPLISDEPIGAGPGFEPGRRDDIPERFRAGAVFTRMLGLGATFHYEGGLHAAIPSGRELECFEAWQEAWTLLPADLTAMSVEAIGPGQPVTTLGAKAVGAYVGVKGDAAWLLAFGIEGRATPLWAPGWTPRPCTTWAQSMLCGADRTP